MDGEQNGLRKKIGKFFADRFGILLGLVLGVTLLAPAWFADHLMNESETKGWVVFAAASAANRKIDQKDFRPFVLMNGDMKDEYSAEEREKWKSQIPFFYYTEAQKENGALFVQRYNEIVDKARLAQ